MSAAKKRELRNKNDFYPTPKWCVDELLAELKPKCMSGKNFLEPCKGDDVIFDKVSLLQPLHREYCELTEGRDYLKVHYSTDIIITNPPFSLAQEFLTKSLGEAQFVAYLLRVNFLGAQKRFEWWQGIEPDHLFILSRRPDFSGEGGDCTEYAWFVWDNLDLCARNPGIHIIWNTKKQKKKNLPNMSFAEK